MPSGSRSVIAVTADFDRRYLAELETMGEVRFGGWGTSGTVPEADELIAFLEGADVLVLSWENVTAEVINATDLRYIASVRGGPGANVDLQAAGKRNIPVTGTIGREALPVAEFTFGLMIGLLRRAAFTSHLLRARDLTSFAPPPPGDIGWGMEPDDPWIKYRGEDLATKRLGIIGLGTVGTMVATRAQAFEMDVVAYDPFANPLSGINMVELDELVATSDVVSIHARYSPETHHLVDRRLLQMMKPTAVLINTARPHLVDSDALADALEAGTIAGAGLDVHPKEPISPDYRLLDLPNVVLTPHIAGSSSGVTRIQTEQVVGNVRRFFAGDPLVALANERFLAAPSSGPQ